MLNRKEFWDSKYGNNYDVEYKFKVIRPILLKADRKGEIGRVVLDLGSGADPLSGLLIKPGRKIIQADISSPRSTSGDILKIRLDLSKPEGIGVLKSKLDVAKFLGIDKRGGDAKFLDSVIISDLLNYLSIKQSKDTFLELKKYLSDSGRIMIFNWPNYGEPEAMSDSRVGDFEEFSEWLEEIGFRVRMIPMPPRSGFIGNTPTATMDGVYILAQINPNKYDK